MADTHPKHFRHPDLPSCGCAAGSNPLLYRRAMSSLRTHFEERAARLSDCATVQCKEESGTTTFRLTPHRADAVGVVLYLGPGDYGTVRLADQAAAPAQLGEDVERDIEAVDHIIDAAVEGRATAFHIGRGGCVEESRGGTSYRSWRNALPWPGWRRRAQRFAYVPYR